MVLTPSMMVKLGTQAPAFTLPEVTSGETYTLESFKGKKALLVMFICRHCPYVQHIKKELAQFARDYRGKDLAIAAINSNDAVKHPDDAPKSLAAFAKEEGFTFPMLYDESQDVAKRYSAACTPDFFLFDAQQRLVYRGQLDDSRPGNDKPLNGKDLRDAVNTALNGNATNATQKPSIGCNIKWKSGNEPDYFKN